MNFGKIGTIAFLSLILAGNATIMQSIGNEGPTAVYSESAASEVSDLYYTRYIPYEVPNGDTSFKSYMDYRCITNKKSKQYEIQKNAQTDADGLRYCGGYYIVALGTFYGKVGTRVRITLDTGVQFYAIIGDNKAICDTDSSNRYYPMANNRKNVVEFIVDTSVLDGKAKKMGDISYIDGDEFRGNVTKIERIQE